MTGRFLLKRSKDILITDLGREGTMSGLKRQCMEHVVVMWGQKACACPRYMEILLPGASSKQQRQSTT